MQRLAQWKPVSVAAALMVVAACSDGPLPTGATIESPLAASLVEQPEQEVALGIAQAMANPTIRSSVLKAFRSSPWVEHKLVLQEFITTSEGIELVAAAAQARGVTTVEFTDQVNALPLLDFYMPSRAERLSWRGENTVGVALSTSMRVTPTSAFMSDGKVIPLTSAHTAGRVLVLLHPAEAKGRRMHRQAALAGLTIQDSDDGEIGVQFIHTLPSGDSVVYDLLRSAGGKWFVMKEDGNAGQELAIAVQQRSANARQAAQSLGALQYFSECEEHVDECEGGGPWTGGPQGPPTSIYYIKARSVCDMDCTAGNEFEFRAKAYSNTSNALVLQGTARVTGVGSGNIYHEPWYGPVPMIFTTIASGVYIDVDVVETDPWPNPDDNFEPNPVLAVASDNFRTFHIGDNRGWNFCTRGEPVCKELSLMFSW